MDDKLKITVSDRGLKDWDRSLVVSEASIIPGKINKSTMPKAMLEVGVEQ